MGNLGELLRFAAKPKWWQFRKRKLHKRGLNKAIFSGDPHIPPLDLPPIQNKTNDGGSNGDSK